MSSKVYLSGPIAGLNYHGATEWRQQAQEYLAEHGIEGLSPMRGREYDLNSNIQYKEVGMNDGVFSTNRAIITRDRFDTKRSDALLVNLEGTTKISCGTVMEIAWADILRIPIIAVMEEGNIHEHGMILEAIGYRVNTLEEALDIIVVMLGK